MKIKKIIYNNNKDIKLLNLFLLKNKTDTFTYFSKRKLTIIKNHICTNLYIYKNEIIGYGHLDNECDKIWLGVLIDKLHRGKGYGKYIVSHLISKCDTDIYLSVYKYNITAIKLYKNIGFKVINDTSNNIFMVYKNNI
jgi:GNAT superfamily N-acetyltransferase